MSYIKPLLKNKIFWAVIIIIGFIWLFTGGEKISPYDTETVSLGTITKEVSATGKVVPATKVDLAFNQGGRINYVAVNIGDRVFRGQLLASLDATELKASLTEAEANLSAQTAKLNQLKRGTRPEELAVAEIDLDNAYLPVYDLLNKAQVTIEDALYEKVDSIFINDNVSPQLTFVINNISLENSIRSSRLDLEIKLSDLKEELSDFNSLDRPVLEILLSTTKDKLISLDSFLSNLLSAVNNADQLSDTTKSTYRNDINTARTNAQTAISNITTQQKSIASAKSNLTLKQAGSTAEDIATQTAVVAQAEAQVDNYQAKLSGSSIYSPLSGLITKREIEAGEFAAAGSVAFSVIDSSGLEIESFIPEVDVSDLVVGNSASITLDAYSSDLAFPAEVISIDPAETIIDGVSTYRVRLGFKEEDTRPRSGMTANIDILVGQKENALYVSQRSVIRDNSRYYVRLLPVTPEGEPMEKDVTVGFRGSDGRIEIIDGLSVGDDVIVFEREI